MEICSTVIAIDRSAANNDTFHEAGPKTVCLKLPNCELLKYPFMLQILNMLQYGFILHTGNFTFYI